jgi:hypothetical protein
MMSWDKEGQYVQWKYLGEIPVSGTISHSRVKYGGGVQHTVILDRPTEVRGRIADSLLLDDEELDLNTQV